jgi:hypothetical protein
VIRPPTSVEGGETICDVQPGTVPCLKWGHVSAQRLSGVCLRCRSGLEAFPARLREIADVRRWGGDG